MASRQPETGPVRRIALLHLARLPASLPAGVLATVDNRPGPVRRRGDPRRRLENPTTTTGRISIPGCGTKKAEPPENLWPLMWTTMTTPRMTMSRRKPQNRLHRRKATGPVLRATAASVEVVGAVDAGVVADGAPREPMMRRRPRKLSLELTKTTRMMTIPTMT